MTGSTQQYKSSTPKCAFLVILLAIAIPYGLSAIQYSMSIENTSITPWFKPLFSLLSNKHFQENDAIHPVQIAFYHKNSTYASFHFVAGGLWIICGLLQFIKKFRTDKDTDINNTDDTQLQVQNEDSIQDNKSTILNQNHLIHRINGWFIVLCIIFSLIGSAEILIVGDAEINSFSGPIYKWVLIMYWIAGFASLTFGMFFIILMQNIIIHRQFMILSYSLAVGAALLRIFWCIIYWYDNNSTQQNNNIPATLYTLFLMLLGCYFSISFGDDMNKRNLRRFIAIADTNNTSTDHSSNKSAESTNKKLVVVGIFVGIFMLQVIFGGFYAVYMMLNSHKNTWFDNRDIKDANVILRIVHWLSWMLVSLFVSCLCFLLVMTKHLKLQRKINFKKYENIVVFGLIVSAVACGIITFIYVSTFKNNNNRFVNHSLGVYWSLRVIIVWIFLASFVYNYYIKINFDRSFGALIHMMWNVNCFTLISILVIVLKWFGITTTKNELFVSSICVETEFSFFFGLVTVALLSDMSKNAKNINVGRARLPWKSLTSKSPTAHVAKVQLAQNSMPSK